MKTLSSNLRRMSLNLAAVALLLAGAANCYACVGLGCGGEGDGGPGLGKIAPAFTPASVADCKEGDATSIALTTEALEQCSARDTRFTSILIGVEIACVEEEGLPEPGQVPTVKLTQLEAIHRNVTALALA